MTDGRATSTDRFVERVLTHVPDPAAARCVIGYVEDSPDQAAIRVFHDVTLRTWTRVPRSAVLHLERMTAAHGPEATVVWIRSDAHVEPSPTPTTHGLADMLDGELLRAWEAEAATQAAARTPQREPERAPA
ncbi:MAG: hypothetical protein IT459_22370 [Planctomycetes bacterium]|nr:hypothetical protein [Planctomycetota bacterium]